MNRIDEREWQEQERAREACSGSSEGTGPGASPYRRIAEALRAAPPPALPADFAATVARAAARQPRLETGLESGLVLILGALLVLGGIATALIYGRNWFDPLFSLLARAPSMPVRLAAMLAICVGLSWLFDVIGTRRLRR